METQTLKQAFQGIARKMEMILRSQAPSKNLAGAIQVTYEDNDFLIAWDDSANYGIYLWRGTLAELAPGAVPGLDDESIQATYDAIWDRKLDLNPGKGKGGIKPRYWLNFKVADIMEFQDEIEDAINLALEEQLQKTIDS